MDPIFIFVGLIVLVIGGYIWYKIWQNKREREYQEKLQQLPESERQVYIPRKEGNKNWGCASAFLLLAVIGNALFAIIEFAGAFTANGAFAVFGGLLNSFCAVSAGFMLWKRKKWGAYGYVTGIILIILISLGTVGFSAVFSGAIPLLVFFAAVGPVWDQLG